MEAVNRSRLVRSSSAALISTSIGWLISSDKKLTWQKDMGSSFVDRGELESIVFPSGNVHSTHSAIALASWVLTLALD